MPLSPSWKAYFLQGLAPVNTIGDCNTKKFTKALTHDAAVDTKMKYLNKDHNLILVTDNKKQVVLLHNIKNLGGATINPTNKVAALFGLGPDPIQTHPASSQHHCRSSHWHQLPLRPSSPHTWRYQLQRTQHVHPSPIPLKGHPQSNDTLPL